MTSRRWAKSSRHSRTMLKCISRPITTSTRCSREPLTTRKATPCPKPHSARLASTTCTWAKSSNLRSSASLCRRVVPLRTTRSPRTTKRKMPRTKSNLQEQTPNTHNNHMRNLRNNPRHTSKIQHTHSSTQRLIFTAVLNRIKIIQCASQLIVSFLLPMV